MVYHPMELFYTLFRRLVKSSKIMSFHHILYKNMITMFFIVMRYFVPFVIRLQKKWFHMTRFVVRFGIIYCHYYLSSSNTESYCCIILLNSAAFDVSTVELLVWRSIAYSSGWLLSNNTRIIQNTHVRQLVNRSNAP